MAQTTYSTTTRRILGFMGETRTTQTALANALGWSQPYISRRVNGQKAWDVDDLDAIAGYFDIPTDVLMFGPSDLRERPSTWIDATLVGAGV